METRKEIDLTGDCKNYEPVIDDGGSGGVSVPRCSNCKNQRPKEGGDGPPPYSDCANYERRESKNPTGPGLKRLHDSQLLESKLDKFRKLSTDEIIKSLIEEGDERLRIKPDGTVMQGNHRIKVLEEQGYDTARLYKDAEVVRLE